MCRRMCTSDTSLLSNCRCVTPPSPSDVAGALDECQNLVRSGCDYHAQPLCLASWSEKSALMTKTALYIGAV